MTYVIAAIAGVVAGVLGWLLASLGLKTKLAAVESANEGLKAELANRDNDLRGPRSSVRRAPR